MPTKTGCARSSGSSTGLASVVRELFGTLAAARADGRAGFARAS